MLFLYLVQKPESFTTLSDAYVFIELYNVNCQDSASGGEDFMMVRGMLLGTRSAYTSVSMYVFLIGILAVIFLFQRSIEEGTELLSIW